MALELSLPAALERAAGGPGGYRFVGSDRPGLFSYAEVFEAARRAASALRAAGLSPGDRVVLVVPEPEAFLTAFLGASVAGCVPVPIYPPLDANKVELFLHHARHVLQASGARAIVTTPAIRRLLGTLRSSVRAVLVAGDLAGAADGPIARPSLSDPAFVQFTSGSTSTPKGVVLTHENLSANIHALGGAHGIGASPADVGVSWLPLFHDMGLIGMALGSIFFGVTTAILSPHDFLRHPVAWLRTISQEKGTISFAPNFAYAFCTRRVKDADLVGLDLSSWRIAGCGAEPIDASVLHAFADRFARVGFRATALLPCYGLAEHTLAVTFPPPGQPLTVDRVDLGALAQRGEAVPAPIDAVGSAAFVSCGRAFPGHDVRVLDADGRPAGDGIVGEIVARGPSVMRGYEGRADLTLDSVRDGWLHTGDLGYFKGGALYVCGRKKDMILVNGRNYYPQDVEWAVGGLPGVRPGGVVAFASGAYGGGGRVVVVVEARQGVEPDALRRAVQKRIIERIGLRVDDVVIAPAGTVSKTSSGKPQRTRTRARYEERRLLTDGTRSGSGVLGQLVASQWAYFKAAIRERLWRT